MTQHINAQVLDHPDGSVTKEKLSKEVTDLLDNINGDSYTKEQVDNLFSTLGDTITIIGDGTDIKSVERQGIYTDGKAYLVVAGNFNAGTKYYFDSTGISVQIMKDKTYSDWIPVKMEETVLYEEVVNTPIWANQPTYEGTLDFDTSDYYYVTLKDAEGTSLPDGQFMLKDIYTENASVYSTVFSLPALDTGNEILEENVPVEFTVDGKMRTAGVGMVTVALNRILNTDVKTIKTTSKGRFIKKTVNDYFTIYYATDKNVSNYHSGATTTWNSDGAKNILHFIGLGADAYKEGKFSDEFILTKQSEMEFNTYRNVLLRCLPYGTASYIHYPKNNAINSFGFGSVLEDNTVLKHVSVVALNGRGYLRNGTVIRVTEVK